MKTVHVYTQPECPPCKIVKQFLDHHNVQYTEYDINKNQEARKKLTSVYRSYSTPTVIVNEEAVTGFNIKKLEELLNI
ncbi:NrdH-redoxin [Bacillus lacus]|uniref:NrdH-redoxin n=1 Tax=Metabacillus lacus TaxID=1983721 RepID=A0A7X2J1L5_9BACI|nr:glutaredoxin domain-containing protein [Metabacillus lacus]MRX73786.1 NrdH-redoxin [Metabacillus lacus]